MDWGSAHTSAVRAPVAGLPSGLQGGSYPLSTSPFDVVSGAPPAPVSFFKQQRAGIEASKWSSLGENISGNGIAATSLPYICKFPGCKFVASSAAQLGKHSAYACHAGSSPPGYDDVPDVSISEHIEHFHNIAMGLIICRWPQELSPR